MENPWNLSQAGWPTPTKTIPAHKKPLKLPALANSCAGRHLQGSGGGGNRTRVPRHFHVDFYVRSRLISAYRSASPADGVGAESDRNLFSLERTRR